MTTPTTTTTKKASSSRKSPTFIEAVREREQEVAAEARAKRSDLNAARERVHQLREGHEDAQQAVETMTDTWRAGDTSTTALDYVTAQGEVDRHVHLMTGAETNVKRLERSQVNTDTSGAELVCEVISHAMPGVVEVPTFLAGALKIEARRPTKPVAFCKQLSPSDRRADGTLSATVELEYLKDQLHGEPEVSKLEEAGEELGLAIKATHQSTSHDKTNVRYRIEVRGTEKVPAIPNVDRAVIRRLPSNLAVGIADRARISSQAIEWRTTPGDVLVCETAYATVAQRGHELISSTLSEDGERRLVLDIAVSVTPLEQLTGGRTFDVIAREVVTDDLDGAFIPGLGAVEEAAMVTDSALNVTHDAIGPAGPIDAAKRAMEPRTFVARLTLLSRVSASTDDDLDKTED